MTTEDVLDRLLLQTIQLTAATSTVGGQLTTLTAQMDRLEERLRKIEDRPVQFSEDERGRILSALEAIGPIRARAEEARLKVGKQAIRMDELEERIRSRESLHHLDDDELVRLRSLLSWLEKEDVSVESVVKHVKDASEASDDKAEAWRERIKVGLNGAMLISLSYGLNQVLPHIRHL